MIFDIVITFYTTSLEFCDDHPQWLQWVTWMHVLSRGGGEHRANGECNANLAIYLQGAPPHVHWVSRYVAFFKLGSMSSDIGKHNVHWVVMNKHHTLVYYIDIPFVLLFFGVLRCVGTHLDLNGIWHDL